MKKKKLLHSAVSVAAIVAMLCTSANYTTFAKKNTTVKSQAAAQTESAPTPSGTVYHVDGTSGSDDGDGTKGKPFKTLEKVNRITLKSGDGISLKKGSIFDKQQLAPKGKGTQEAPIVINTYGGDGDRPVINAGGFTRIEGSANPDGTPAYSGKREAVLIENMEYTWVTGLEVTNDDVFNQTSKADDKDNWKDVSDDTQPRRLGIHVTIDERAVDTYKGSDREYRGITIDDCYVHDVDGNENRGVNKVDGGIGVEVIFRSSTKVYPYFNGVTIQNNQIDQCDRTGIKGIRITDIDNFRNNDPTKPGYDPNNDADNNGANDQSRHDNIRLHEQAQRGYKVVGNYLSDIGGDGILICETQDAIVEHNVLNGNCMRARGANAGIWSWNAFDTMFRYNESFGGPAYNQDGCSFDSDYWSAGSTFEYNYSHDTPMGFMLLMGGNDMDIVRYNVSQNDGVAWRHIAGNSNTPSYIYNNVFYYDGAKWKYNYSAPAMAGRSNWQMFNNIFYNTSESQSSNWGADGDWSKVALASNMVYEKSGKSGVGEIPGAIHADPKFVMPGAGKSADMTNLTSNWDSLQAYQLQKGSPAINAGTFVNVVQQSTPGNEGHWDTTSNRNVIQDFYGNPLYNGAADIGLHETTEVSEADYKIEANASYKIYDQTMVQYILAGKSGQVGMDAAGTEFIMEGSGEGYKIRVWDTDQNAYLFLNAADGKAVLSEDPAIWKAVDMHNGLHRLETGGKSLSSDKKTLVMKANESATQWQLQLQEHSKSYNVGGNMVDGYSADQEYVEAKSQSGNYEETSKVNKSLSGKAKVYETALTGDTVGYKIFASKGEYNLKLNFAELENVSDRTFSIIINGKVCNDAYTLKGATSDVEIGSVFPENGVIDVQLKYGYNSQNAKTKAILNGITAEKLVMSEVNNRLNCGKAQAFDGLSADAKFPENGSGYYGEGTTKMEFTALPNPDAGMGTVLKSAREGELFGYKFKAQPGSYRVKMYFNDASASDHMFQVSVNGADKTSVNVKEQAGGSGKAMAVTKIANSVNGIIDVQFEGTDGKKAMVNAIIVEPYTQPEGKNLALGKTAFEVSTTKDDNTTSYGAALAADGNDATRWSTQDGDATGWYQIDLEKPYMIDRVAVDWTPGAYATGFGVETSVDGETWEVVKTVKDAEPGLNVITIDPSEAQYVKIVSQAANDRWGISFTELEIYGEEVTGAAETILNSEKIADPSKDYEVKVQLQNIYKRYSTVTVKASFDNKKAEFVQDAKLNNTLNQIGETIMSTDEKTGLSIREYQFDIMQKDAFKVLNEVLKMQFTTKGEERASILIDVKFSDAAGHYTSLDQKKAYVPSNVSDADLKTLIQEAGKLESEAAIGVKPGTYTQEAVDTLRDSAAEAQKTADAENASQQELADAFTVLESAMETFKSSVNVASYKSYHEDFAVDTVANYANAVVKNNTVNLTATPNTIVVNTKAPELLSGTFYAKFSTTGSKAHYMFNVKNAGKPIIIGYDSSAKHWFYDKTADNKWGTFATGRTLEPNKVHELMVEFRHKSGGEFDLILTVDGEKFPAKSVKYDETPGGFGFAARSQTENCTLYESYYTNAPAYQIAVSSNMESTVSQTGTISVFGETDKTFQLNPPNGYGIKEIQVDGKPVQAVDNAYTFEFIQSDHTMDVTFERTDGQEGITYHRDYKVDTESGFTPAGAVENGEEKIALTKSGGDKGFHPVTAKAVPQLASGTLYTRFTVDNTGDQTLFFVKDAGRRIIIGYDGELGQWFFDNAASGAGYGYYNQGGKLIANKEHEAIIQFVHKGGGIYDLTLIVDGQNLGTKTNQMYDEQPGGFGYSARRMAKNMSIKEMYYSNMDSFQITVEAGKNGVISQSGTVKVYQSADKTFQFTPDAGYVLDKVTADGLEVAEISGDRYTFKDVQGNHSLSVTFNKELDVADKTELQGIYDTHKNKVQGNYTDDSWNVFAAALGDTKTVLENADASQAEVDEKEKLLQAAIDGLETTTPPIADKTELLALYDSVKNTEKGHYTEESWGEFTAALVNAKKVIDDEHADQPQVNAAQALLGQAYSELKEVEIPSADKSKLTEAIAGLNELKESDYMSDSYQTLMDAKKAAQKVLDNQLATQEQVDSALNALTTAKSKLVPKKGSVVIVPGDPSVPPTTINGEFAEDAVLNIAPITSKDEVYKEIAAKLPKGSQVLAAMEMNIQGEAKGPFAISFQIGNEHNGRMIIVLHKKADGTIESFENLVVKNGMITIQVTELSPFVIALQSENPGEPGKPENPGEPSKPANPGNPATPDNSKVPSGNKTEPKVPDTSDPMNAGTTAAGMALTAGAIIVLLKKRK